MEEFAKLQFDGLVYAAPTQRSLVEETPMKRPRADHDGDDGRADPERRLSFDID